MNTRHAIIDSPVDELTLVADGGALVGVYFRHHWFGRPRTHSDLESRPRQTMCWPSRRPSSTIT